MFTMAFRVFLPEAGAMSIPMATPVAMVANKMELGNLMDMVVFWQIVPNVVPNELPLLIGIQIDQF